jgi:uncharacterized protein YcfJ
MNKLLQVGIALGAIVAAGAAAAAAVVSATTDPHKSTREARAREEAMHSQRPGA